MQVFETGQTTSDSVAGVRDTMGAATRGELSSLLQKEPMELAMKCNDLSRSLVAFDQNSTLVAVVELSPPAIAAIKRGL